MRCRPEAGMRKLASGVWWVESCDSSVKAIAVALDRNCFETLLG
jgi:hypothetical protein